MPRMRPLLAVPVLFLAIAPLARAQAVKPAEALSAAEMKEADGLLREYLAAKTTAEKAGIAERLAAIDHPSRADVGKLAQKAFLYAKAGVRLTDKNQQKCTHPDYPGQFEMQVASGAKKGQPTGVFILLHGGGAGVGDGAQIKSLLGAPGTGMINVWPTVIQKDDSAWNSEREERYVLAILEDLKRTFSVDTNRVFLAGHSMGGYGTWSIGPRHADLFAAGSAMAGGIFVGGKDGEGKLILAQGIVPNLKNLPFWFFNSTDDKQVRPDSSIRAAEVLDDLKEKYGPFDYVWKKYADIGHGLPKEGVQEIWKFMLAKKRDPLPKRVVWEPSREYKRHFFWVKSADGNGLVDVQREGNRFTVTGRAAGLTLLLNEKMVKFDQPVVVVDDAGKELFNGKVKLSLLAMAETIDVKRDPEMWFAGWVELK
ncbi:MAG: hypothetical protein HYY18_22880 [Planctomycetes bacterium]|nr:hypothetical protein [Planctomycetota bacterium]